MAVCVEAKRLRTILMQMKGPAIVGLLLFTCVSAVAAPRPMERVVGPGFEGVIFTPERVHEDTTPYYYACHALYRPAREAVLKAEKDLPARPRQVGLDRIRSARPEFFDELSGEEWHQSQVRPHQVGPAPRLGDR